MKRLTLTLLMSAAFLGMDARTDESVFENCNNQKDAKEFPVLKSGKAKSLKTVLKNKNVYHVNHAIKLGKYNVGREEEVFTIPLYMGFLIKDKLADIIVPDIDLSVLA